MKTELDSFFLSMPKTEKTAFPSQNTLWVSLHKTPDFNIDRCGGTDCNTVPPGLVIYPSNESFVWDATMYNLMIDNAAQPCFVGYARSFQDLSCTANSRGLCRVTCQPCKKLLDHTVQSTVLLN